MQATVIANHRQPSETRDRPDIKPGPVVQTEPEKSAVATNPVSVSELCPTVDRTSTNTTVRCRGRITLETAQLLRATVKPLFSNSTGVMLDLTHVSYTDSSGLGTIVGLCASATAANCGLKLINLNRRLKESLSIARVNELLVDPAFWRTW